MGFVTTVAIYAIAMIAASLILGNFAGFFYTLIAAIVLACLTRIMERQARIEKKLDQLLEQKEEN